MVDGFVAGELAARLVIGVQFVGMQRALARGIDYKHLAQALAGEIIDLDGAGTSAALNQRHHKHLLAALVLEPAELIREAPFFRLLRAEPRLVRFDDLAFAAERAANVNRAVHGFPDPVRHEPRATIRSEAEHPLQLQGAKAFLRCCVIPETEHPLMQRDMAAL